MALTENFKKFVLIVSIVGATAGLYVAGKPSNYWGLLDVKPKAVAEAPAPVAAPEVPVVMDSDNRDNSRAREGRERETRNVDPVAETPVAPAAKDATINKLKGLDKLN